MSERKVVVPHGMFCAAHQAQEGHNGGIDGGLTGAIVEAALRWLGENPMVPSEEQERSLDTAWIEAKQSQSNRFVHATAFGAVEWQRRMFLAPEPEVEPLTMYIMRHFDDVELDKQTLRNRAEAAVSDFREHENRNFPEPEEPEEIKDLLDGVSNPEQLKCVLEAYRQRLAKR